MGLKNKRPDKKSGKSSKGSTDSLKNLDVVSDNVGDGDIEVSAADKLRKIGIICTCAESSKKMHRNTPDISVSNIQLTFHGQPMIEEAELALNYGNRYGFIGRNGCGKSTFMKAIAARCFPIPEGIEIYHLSEEIEPTELTAMQAVMEVDTERKKLETEAEEIQELMADEKADDEAIDRLTQIYERLDELDAASAEVRASKILTGLGFSEKRKSMMTKEFSGGWRMRIALARALFLQPTMLLLDEPTNHLDMEAVVWLEDYLSKWDKILLMVSHSQDFMNSVCSNIMHLKDKRLTYYGGNYDTFVNTKAELEEDQMKRYKKEQEEIAHMKQYIARFGQGNSKMAKQAQSKEKTLAKMTRGGLTDKVGQEKGFDFKFPDPGPLPPPVLQCTNITFGYPSCEILYSNVDFGVDLDSRVALVGPNGAGKSTLLKIMTGDLDPVVGSVRPHAHLRISKFNQHFMDVLDLTMTPIDYFRSIWTDMTLPEARSFLGRFGISGQAQTSIMETLSDGQKSRVVLAKMAKESPHMLFLDEPTNHLDMESIDSLAKAINQFQGGMVLVSHDMRLISQVAKEIWMCDNKCVTRFTGEISDFKMHLRKQMQKDNILEGGSGGNTKADNSQDYSKMFVPLTPLTALSATLETAPKGHMTVAPPAPPSMDLEKANKEREEMIRKEEEKKRKEDEERSIAAAAKSGETVEDDTTVTTSATESTEVEPDWDSMTEKEKEKALKAKRRKAEKEAKQALQKKQEEEVEIRRLQKIKDNEEARQLKIDQEAKMEEFRAEKAAREAKEAAIEAERLRAEEEELARRKEELKEKKRREKERRLQAEAIALQRAEEEVLADVWTQAQQLAFETVLLDNGPEVIQDRGRRWDIISAAVTKAGDGHKTRNQCVARYAYLKRHVREMKRAQISKE